MNLDLGQILTLIESIPPGSPIVIQAGAVTYLIQQIVALSGAQPVVPYYPNENGLAPNDMTQFPGV